FFLFFFQAEDGIRDGHVTGVQTCALPICDHLALAHEAQGEVIAYSGDTEWTETLVDAARAADLFIAEALFVDKRVKFHLDVATLLANRARLGCRRLVLTHMSDDVLGRLEELGVEAPEDGRELVV